VVHHFVWLLEKKGFGIWLEAFANHFVWLVRKKRSRLRFKWLAGWFVLLHHGQLLLSEAIEDMDVVVCNRMRE
jgi:hypothetical protein